MYCSNSYNLGLILAISSFLLSPQSQSPGDSDGPLSPQNVKPTTFAAEYMGSVEVPEEKLVKGKSVHVVFSSIEELSGDENDPPVHMQLVANLKRVSILIDINRIAIKSVYKFV